MVALVGKIKYSNETRKLMTLKKTRKDLGRFHGKT